MKRSGGPLRARSRGLVRPGVRMACSLMLVGGLAGCGTLSRSEGADRLIPAVLTPIDVVRVRASNASDVRALSQDFARRLATPDGKVSILALSGGGAKGAYGAGVIVGWTQSGQRPAFSIVTGVSTGALAAPFAFLGPTRDDDLKAAYTGERTEGLLRWRALAALLAPSLFSPASLRDLVDENVTPALLREVAAEHAKGRRLFVVTTNLDAEEAVIWDMGALAARDDEPSLQRFRQVLLASASIPGVFPPVLIAGRSAEGELVQEMHVDGGVNAPFLAVPESLLGAALAEALPPGGAIYILVNGGLAPDARKTDGRLRAILARTYDSASKASLRTHLAANAAFAARNGLQLYVSAIPREVESSSLDFSPQAMKQLFELGRTRALSGEAWRDGEALSPPAPF